MPTDTPLVEEDRTMSWFWVQFFVSQQQQIQDAAAIIIDTQVAGTAAIAATALNVGTSSGLYRMSLYARITRAATTNSSLTPTFRWTEGGVALSKTYTAVTGNTTATYLVDTFPFRIDASSPVTYETAYASTGATSMTYSLEMSVERLA